MSSDHAKQQLLAGLAAVGRALGNEHRLRILELLAQRATSVEALAERVGLSIANASQHLRLLRAAGLLTSRRDGKHVLYVVSDPTVLQLTAALGQVAERNLAQVREVINGYCRERDTFEPISRWKASMPRRRMRRCAPGEPSPWCSLWCRTSPPRDIWR